MKKRSKSRSRFEKIEELMEHGTPELNDKHLIEWEQLDPKGYVRRARVADQTELDRLFLLKKISGPQFEAGSRYFAALIKSGSFVRSPSFERGIDSSVKDVEKSISSRIMAVSAARRALKMAGDRSMMIVDLVVASGRRISAAEMDDLLAGLDALSMFYGTQDFIDPRSISIR